MTKHYYHNQATTDKLSAVQQYIATHQITGDIDVAAEQAGWIAGKLKEVAEDDSFFCGYLRSALSGVDGKMDTLRIVIHIVDAWENLSAGWYEELPGETKVLLN